MATAFSGLVLGMALLRGWTEYPQYETETLSIIRAYYLAGVFTGTLLGLLRPWLATRLGRVAVSILCATAIYGVVGLTMLGASGRTLAVALIAGVFGGSLFSYLNRDAR